MFSLDARALLGLQVPLGTATHSRVTIMNADYPRPDFQRTNLCWQSLDGVWDFLFDDRNEGVHQGWHTHGLPSVCGSHSKRDIIVPYTFQHPASGINDHNAHAVVWYEQIVRVPQSQRACNLLLRCGAVDYETDVWINGHHVGFHRGGHTPFEFDITDETDRTDFRITVRVFDSPADKSQPRGKQYWGAKPENIFYTPSTGIWQSVWLESVPKTRIADASRGTYIRANDIGTGELQCEIFVLGPSDNCCVTISASLLGHSINSVSTKVGPDAVARARFSLRSTSTLR